MFFNGWGLGSLAQKSIVQSAAFLIIKKSNKRLMARTITRETKKEGQRKAKRSTAHRNQTKRRELVLLMVVGSYLTHGPSN
jgi:hypothetical protein